MDNTSQGFNFGNAWPGMLMMLGAGLGAASGQPMNNTMLAFALAQQNRKNEANDFAKAAEAVGTASKDAGNDPSAFIERLNALRPKFGSPAASKFLDTALERAHVRAEKMGAAADEKRRVVDPVMALLGRVNQSGGPLQSQEGQDYQPLQQEPVTTYRHELAGIPGVSKVFDVAGFPEHPQFDAAKAAARERAITGPLLERKKQEIPLNVEEAIEKEKGVAPLRIQNEVEKAWALIAPDLFKQVQSFNLLDPLKRESEMKSLVARIPVELQAKLNEIRQTAQPLADAAATKINTTAGPQANADYLSTVARERGQRAVAGPEVYYPPNGREFWSGKDKEQTTLTRDQAFSRPWLEDQGVVDVSQQEGNQMRLIKGAMPQLESADKLVKKLLSPAGSEQFKKAGQYAVQKMLQTNPDVAQLVQTMDYLAIEGGRILGGSVRIPVTMLGMLKGTLPTSRASLEVAQRELSTFRTDMNNRLNAVLRQPLEVIDTGPDKPAVNVRGLKLNPSGW